MIIYKNEYGASFKNDATPINEIDEDIIKTAVALSYSEHPSFIETEKNIVNIYDPNGITMTASGIDDAREKLKNKSKPAVSLLDGNLYELHDDKGKIKGFAGISADKCYCCILQIVFDTLSLLFTVERNKNEISSNDDIEIIKQNIDAYNTSLLFQTTSIKKI
ncbi:MAG: hypothetical protein IJS80_05460 [Lachnospiraceae bacterium]|nr:hypothetical protein [Lachnospiraceae bacterium]